MGDDRGEDRGEMIETVALLGVLIGVVSALWFCRDIVFGIGFQ